MDIVIDTSALVAVLLSEPERPGLVRATKGAALIAPASVHWEVGNALSAALKRHRVTTAQAQRALAVYERIPVRFVDVELGLALEIAAREAIYAYDAYLLACALIHRAPLLTLDARLARTAAAAAITLVEVDA